MEYKAVYSDDAFQVWPSSPAGAALRPTDEYRVPTDEDVRHSRATSNDARFPLARAEEPSARPAFMNKLVYVAHYSGQTRSNGGGSSIRDNLKARSPRPNAKAGSVEVEGLQISLAAAEYKLAQIDKRLEPGPLELGNQSQPSPFTKPDNANFLQVTGLFGTFGSYSLPFS
jgi:hypothetical protein